MLDDRTSGDLPEPTEREYLEGIIMLLSIALIIYFEVSLKYLISEPLRHKAEVIFVLLLIGSVHLLCSHLLAFFYNSRHLRFFPFLFAKRSQAAPRHARMFGLFFVLAAIVAFFL
jgi:hypothetical protein